MTLENCERLLKHFQDTEQTERAEEMKQHIAKKKAKILNNMHNPSLPHSRYLGQFKSEKPPEKKHVKKST